MMKYIGKENKAVMCFVAGLIVVLAAVFLFWSMEAKSFVRGASSDSEKEDRINMILLSSSLPF